MKSRTDGPELLERALFAARRRREVAVPGAGWQDAVMGDIRRRALRGVEEAKQAFVARFAWRLSAVAACVALALLIYALSRGFVDYEELAMLFLEDPAGFLI